MAVCELTGSPQEGCSECTITKASTRKIPAANYRISIYLISVCNQNTMKTRLQYCIN